MLCFGTNCVHRMFGMQVIFVGAVSVYACLCVCVYISNRCYVMAGCGLVQSFEVTISEGGGGGVGPVTVYNYTPQFTSDGLASGVRFSVDWVA